MALLASEIMDQAASVYLNDSALALFTYAAQLPFLKIANEKLEQILIENDEQVQRVKSSVIPVTAGALTLTLPADFLLPIRLFERISGATNDKWFPMKERDWEPEDAVQVNSLNFWSFRNNAINLVGANQNRDVLLEYERQLAVIIGSTSPEDFYLAKGYLSAKTAELCARFIGMNDVMANSIRDNEVIPAQNRLVNILVMNKQGQKFRRARFTTKRVTRIL